MSYFNTTLKRNSKLDLSRSDLLKLVSMLEGELQAREVAIAVLKSEQIKRLLNPHKNSRILSGFKLTKNLNSCGPTSIDLTPDQTIKYSADPLNALSRDSLAVYEPSLDHSTTLALFNLKIFQLENLINNQTLLREKFNGQVKSVEQNYEKVLCELEGERKKNRELELKFCDYDRIKLEDEIKKLTQSLEETQTRERQIILSLLGERKHLIIKLIEERHQNEELRQQLTSAQGKCAEMVEGLEDESKRSLLMEAELERNLSEFESEKSSLKVQLQLSESKNIELTKEVELLKNAIECMQKQVSTSGIGKSAIGDLDSAKWNIGEGVRSSIVTMPASTKVHSLSSVTAVAHPKASVAQPVTKSIPCTSTILPPPSIPVPQPKQGTASIKKNSTSTTVSTIPTAATVSSISSSSLATSASPSSSTATIAAIAEPEIDNENVISKSIQHSIILDEATTGKSIKQVPPTEPSKTNSDNSVKQSIMFYEKSANQNKTAAVVVSATHPTATMRKSSIGSARVPPPVPPNKPSIKPVLPSQAILHQNKIKDANNLLGKTNSQTKASSCMTTASSGISKG